YKVTGVQTCALPIFSWRFWQSRLAAEDRDVGRRQRGLLQPFELDERLAVREHGLQLVDLRRCQIPLRLHDEVVRRHADFELALRSEERRVGKEGSSR